MNYILQKDDLYERSSIKVSYYDFKCEVHHSDGVFTVLIDAYTIRNKYYESIEICFNSLNETLEFVNNNFKVYSDEILISF